MTEQEFERLYAAEHPLLVRQFRRLYRELAEDVEDVVQDAFERLWAARNASPEIPIHHPGKWVYRVVNNAMIDLARTRRTRKLVPLWEETTSDLDEAAGGRLSAGSSDELVRAELGVADLEAVEADLESRRLAVLYALERVNPLHKTLLLELYINGKSYDDLARITGHSRSALGTTLLRARRTVLKLAREYLARSRSEELRVLD